MRSHDPLLPGEKKKLNRLALALREWAVDFGRSFPWRRDECETYEKIVVEVLLQRTTATAVSRFYSAFIERFPSWDVLAAAEPVELEQFLKPLGLWRRRATSLLGLARFAASTKGEFPRDPALHAGIPAVGQYVSNAVMLFQHGQPAPLLDVNMSRVIERFVRPRKLADIRHDPWLQEAAAWYSRGKESAATNWAMLDFAATVCKSRAPLCGECPVNRYCAYFRDIRAKSSPA